jgi:hypothetical protein
MRKKKEWEGIVEENKPRNKQHKEIQKTTKCDFGFTSSAL